jgi:hypothetical protein
MVFWMAPGMTVVSGVSAQSALAETRLEELQRRYAEAGGIPQEALHGWVSGRCFWSGRPDLPTNGLLVVQSFASGGDGGPLFPPRQGLKTMILQDATAGADETHFDELSSADVRTIDRYVQANAWSYDESVADSSGTWSGRWHRGVSWTLRMSAEGYFIALTEDEDSRVNGACYFFRRVRE